MSLNRCPSCGHFWGVVNAAILYCECPKILRMRGPGFYCTAWNGTLYAVFEVGGRAYWNVWSSLAPATRIALFARAAWSSWHAGRVTEAQ